jgi:tetratricopeptide (TPR) repeat protein
MFALLSLCMSIFVQARGGVPVAPQGEQKPVSEQNRMKQAYYFFEGKKRIVFSDYENAATCFERAIKADPYCDACYYELSQIYAERGRTEEAVSLSHSAYGLDTANVWYALQLARLLVLQQKVGEAEEMYSLCIQKNPQLREAYIEVLMLYDQQNAFPEAIALLNLYEEIFGADETSMLTKQSVYYKWGKYPQATRIVEQLIDAYPTEQCYYLMASELYSVQDRDTLVWANLMKARQIDSVSLEYLSVVADFCRESSDYDGYFTALGVIFSEPQTPLSAKLQILEALLRQPKLANLYASQVLSFYDNVRSGKQLSYQVELLFARYLLQNQKFNQTLSCLRASMENARTDTALKSIVALRQASPYFKSHALESLAFYNMSMLYLDLLLQLQQWDEIIVVADKYILRNEDRPRMLFLKGLALSQKKEYVKAAKSTEEVLKQVSPQDTGFLLQIYSTLGDAYNSLGRYSKSDKTFDKALSLDPGNVLILNNYAYYLSLRGKKLKKAMNMSKLAIKQEPENPTYLDTYAWILFQIGEYKESKQIFQKALVFGGDAEAVILEHYGDVLFKLGEISNALIYWNRVKEKGGPSEELLQKLKEQDIKK